LFTHVVSLLASSASSAKVFAKRKLLPTKVFAVAFEAKVFASKTFADESVAICFASDCVLLPASPHMFPSMLGVAGYGTACAISGGVFTHF